MRTAGRWNRELLVKLASGVHARLKYASDLERPVGFDALRTNHEGQTRNVKDIYIDTEVRCDGYSESCCAAHRSGRGTVPIFGGSALLKAERESWSCREPDRDVG